MKYEYLLHTWGGFYNDKYKKIHNKSDGYIYFDTKEERQTYIDELKTIEKELNATMLVMGLSEGFHCRTVTTLHRVIRYEGKNYYSKREMSPNYPYDVAMYHMEWKWQPGFNDYPLGEDFNYEDEDSYEVLQEWVTGAFTMDES